MDWAGVMKAAGLAACVVGSGLTVRFLAGPIVRPPSAAWADEASAGTGVGSTAVAATDGASGAAPASSGNADSLAGAIARRDPFRLARAPAAVPFNPDAPATPGIPLPPRPQRPALALVGLVLGAERAALIDGLPGVEGTRVLRVGERVGEYALRAIGAETAVIAGPDTVWTLRVRSPSP